MARGKPAEKGKILDRQNQALDLRKQGFSYRAIGSKLGMSQMQAFRDIQDELKRLAMLNLNAADELRQLELERLDRVIESMDHWMQAGNTQAAITILKAMDTRAKLLGLYAPEKIREITWQDEIIQLLRDKKITRDDVLSEIEPDLAEELFKSAGIPITSE